MGKPLRDESRVNYITGEGPATLEQINAGSLMRIADSVETLAKDRDQLERRLKFYQDKSERLEWDLDTERRRSAALRGHITRIKRAALEGKDV